MRLRDQNKADLGLAALTLTAVIVGTGYEVSRWARQRLGRGRLRRDPDNHQTAGDRQHRRSG